MAKAVMKGLKLIRRMEGAGLLKLTPLLWDIGIPRDQQKALFPDAYQARESQFHMEGIAFAIPPEHVTVWVSA